MPEDLSIQQETPAHVEKTNELPKQIQLNEDIEENEVHVEKENILPLKEIKYIYTLHINLHKMNKY